MSIEEARLYLEHTSKDDFNLEEWQKENRYKAIQVILQEIESQKRVINGMIDNEEQYCLEINKLNNIIDNAIEETELGIQILQETKENYPNINCDVVINKYLKPIYKALKDSDKND